MELSDLETFLTVARERNFSRAAERLFRTQPAVSIAVKRLESWAGEPLFERGSREVHLTDAGGLMVEYAERILNLRAASRKGLEELSRLDRGLLTLGVNECWIHAILPTLADFRRLHPEVQISVERIYSREIPRAITNYKLDLGILSFRPEEKKLEATEFLQDTLSFVVSTEHRLAGRRSITISDLGGETFAAHIAESVFRSRVIRLFSDYHVPLNMIVQLPTIESIKRFVQMEMAVAIVPRTTVEWELDRGWICEIPVPQLDMTRRLYFVHRRGAHLSHSTLELMRLLQESGKNGGGKKSKSKPKARPKAKSRTSAN